MSACGNVRAVDAGMPDAYTCTLLAGHDGEHHHHDGEAVCASWENVPRKSAAQIMTDTITVIRRHMDARGVNLSQLADLSGIDDIRLKWVLWDRRPMTIAELFYIAAALEVSPGDLVREGEDLEQDSPPAGEVVGAHLRGGEGK